VQRVYAAYTTMTTTTTTVPQDDTIPQNTEGAETVTATITPTNAANRLRIRVSACVGASNNGSTAVALFRDSGADAKFATAQYHLAGHMTNLSFVFEEDAGGTSATTYKLRVGPRSDSGGTVTFNGIAGVRIYGGVAAHVMIIEELTP
jgi:hypothetical protein